jgi:hypothetical protein
LIIALFIKWRHGKEEEEMVHQEKEVESIIDELRESATSNEAHDEKNS